MYCPFVIVSLPYYLKFDFLLKYDYAYITDYVFYG